MSESCTVESCESTLGISCHCCDKTFCSDHLDEHYESINAQLNPLVNEINTLTDQIKVKTKEKLIGNCLEKLNTWRDEYFKMINSLYEKKRQEFEQYYAQKTEKQRKEIDKMQLKITKLIHEQDTTQEDIQFFKSTIENIKYEIKEIHQTGYEIHIRPLEFYDNFISIEETKSDEIDFTTLLSPYKTIDCLEEYLVACASNDKFLLIYQN
jgi:chromosome segregation ATPase